MFTKNNFAVIGPLMIPIGGASNKGKQASNELRGE